MEELSLFKTRLLLTNFLLFLPEHLDAHKIDPVSIDPALIDASALSAAELGVLPPAPAPAAGAAPGKRQTKSQGIDAVVRWVEGSALVERASFL